MNHAGILILDASQMQRLRTKNLLKLEARKPALNYWVGAKLTRRVKPNERHEQHDENAGKDENRQKYGVRLRASWLPMQLAQRAHYFHAVAKPRYPLRHVAAKSIAGPKQQYSDRQDNKQFRQTKPVVHGDHVSTAE